MKQSCPRKRPGYPRRRVSFIGLYDKTLSIFKTRVRFMPKTTKSFWLRFLANIVYDSLILKFLKLFLLKYLNINIIFKLTLFVRQYSLLACKILYNLHCSRYGILSYIIDLYFFKLSRIDFTVSRVQHHFVIPLAFNFLAIAQRKQLIAHALCIDSLTEFTRQGEPKCLHGNKLSRLEG